MARTTPARSPFPVSVLTIHHETTYEHTAPATAAWQVVRLMPRDESGQECLAFDLDVRPAPGEVARRPDYFGNATHVFSVRGTHTHLAIAATSVVRRTERPLPMAGLTPTLEAARASQDTLIAGGEFSLEQYRQPSPFVPALPAARALTARLDPARTPLLEWIQGLGAVFAGEFTFDPTATTLSTPVAQVLESRRGVCQDFAHLALACARAHGLAASYVSGYILTHPPPGMPRLRGADAMHAWISIHVPGTGWVDYDPTNTCFAGSGHVVVARGRDYGDVSPIRGIFSGGGRHTLTLGVTVEPEEASA